MTYPLKIAAGLFVTGVLVCVLMPQARAQTTNVDFQQALTEYQKSPSVEGADKVIKLALALDQLPTVPEEARKHFVKGAALFKEAKSLADFTQVRDEFAQAARLAPWWPDARYNLALALESSGDYPSAMANLKLYQLFKLPDTDARVVQDKIYVLEAKQEKAAKESNPEVVAAKKESNYAEWLKKLDGARYTGQSNLGNDLTWDNELVIRGNILTWRQRTTYACSNCVLDFPLGQWYDLAQYGGRMQIVGREAKRFIPPLPNPNDIFTISEDGSSITQVSQTKNGGTFTFYRQ